MKIHVLAIGLATLLGACAHNDYPTSVSGGEAKVFERPPYEVCGVTNYDQHWVNSQVEGGVAAFNWQRPAPRPATLGPCPPSPQKVVVKQVPKKKPSFLKRVVKKIKAPFSTPASAPSEPFDDQHQPFVDIPMQPTEMPNKAPAYKVPPIVSEPQHRDKVDELLHPSR